MFLDRIIFIFFPQTNIFVCLFVSSVISHPDIWNLSNKRFHENVKSFPVKLILLFYQLELLWVRTDRFSSLANST